MTRKKNNPDEPHDIHGGLIARGSVPFISVSKIGELGDKGKVVMSIGYSGRIVGKSNMPLASLTIPVMQMLLDMVRWDSDKSAREDIAVIEKYLKGLVVKK